MCFDGLLLGTFWLDRIGLLAAALAATVATVAVGAAFDGLRVLLPSTSPSLGRALLAFWLLLTLIQVRGLI